MRAIRLGVPSLPHGGPHGVPQGHRLEGEDDEGEAQENRDELQRPADGEGEEPH